MIDVKSYTTILHASSLLSSSKDKSIVKDILKKLMRDMRELKVEMNVLKKNIRSHNS